MNADLTSQPQGLKFITKSGQIGGESSIIKASLPEINTMTYFRSVPLFYATGLQLYQMMQVLTPTSETHSPLALLSAGSLFMALGSKLGSTLELIWASHTMTALSLGLLAFAGILAGIFPTEIPLVTLGIVSVSHGLLGGHWARLTQSFNRLSGCLLMLLIALVGVLLFPFSWMAMALLTSLVFLIEMGIVFCEQMDL